MTSRPIEYSFKNRSENLGHQETHQSFSMGKIEERVSHHSNANFKSDSSKPHVPFESNQGQESTVINPFVTSSHLKMACMGKPVTPQKDSHSSFLPMCPKPEREESPWKKFVNSAKKIAKGVGHMIGLCEKTPDNPNNPFMGEASRHNACTSAERRARQERNSTGFKPLVNQQKEKLEKIAQNPDFHSLMKVSFSERVKNKSLQIKEAAIEVEEDFRRQSRENLPGETALEAFSRRISAAYMPEDIYSGFKPKRSENSEGKAFYAQLLNANPGFGIESSVKNNTNMLKDIPVANPSFGNSGQWFKKEIIEKAIVKNKYPTEIQSTNENSLIPTPPQQMDSLQPEDIDNEREVSYQYQISEVEDSDQDLNTQEVWKEEEDSCMLRSYSNSNTRNAFKEEFKKIRSKFPNDPPNDLKLFNKRSGLNLSQTEFQDLVRLNTPAKAPTKKRKVLWINNKRVPDWAADLKAIGKEVIAQNTFGRYKQVFGKVKHIKMLEVHRFFRPELLKNYKR